MILFQFLPLENQAENKQNKEKIKKIILNQKKGIIKI